ncbi:hypothetical protein ACFPK1_26740 [Actinomycetospora rhizophila]|uniref:DUF485 domain-containing protein n=1 Tax=Actinomycetospora rhizophila TaxID=1416876 RepID=A0ABV9ZK34_9PSEU
MTSPGGPARASVPAAAAAGTERAGEDGAPLRPVPDPPPKTADDGGDGSDGTGDGAEPPVDTPDDPADDRGAGDAAGSDGWPGQGPDTGTVARSRPSRSPRVSTGVPTPPSPMAAATGPHPPGAPDPPRRPVPPTFPSPGQPPPGVARRHGRHARPERPGAVHTPPSGYRPRHAAPDAETEQFAATPVTGPGGIGPMPLPLQDDEVPAELPAAHAAALEGAATTADTPTAAATATAGASSPPGGTLLHTSPGLVVPPVHDDDGGADRVRVVLAERRVPTRAVRTVAEIEQQTETGELLLRNLLRAQLALGLRLGLVAVFVLGALPVLFLVLPRFGSFEIASGVTLPWLVLGLLPYPFMLALAWLYVRTAERNELDFADNVED